MRCPKCGYISFDYQDTCRKCNKNIGDAVTEVNGTVCDALPPAFLQLETKIRFPAQPLPPDKTTRVADSEQESAVREGIDTEFFLDDEETPLADDSEELVMDLDDFSEVSPQEEFTLDFDKDRSGIETDLPTLDFGDLDISDLAPPDKEVAPPLLEEELKPTSIEPIAALSENLPPQPKTPPTKSTGLEDLHLDGLNLDSPPKFATDSAAGKPYFPSVKTGTALDKFDVDLGELFPKQKVK